MRSAASRDSAPAARGTRRGSRSSSGRARSPTARRRRARSTSRFLVEHVEVLDDLRMLVHPLDRIGLQHELALDEEAAREHEDARDRQCGRDAVRQRSEPPRQPAKRALAEVAALGGRAVLADAENSQRADDAVEADRDHADDQQQPRTVAASGPWRSATPRTQRSRRTSRRAAQDRGCAVFLIDGRRSITTPSLDSRASDGVVDADAEHHRQPGDGDDP